MYEAILDGAHLAVPEDVPGMLDRHVSGIGGTGVTLYLTDLEQTALHPVPRRGQVAGESMLIDTTLAGRCYQRITIECSGRRSSGTEVGVWVPVLDGTERLGVLEVTMAAHPGKGVHASCASSTGRTSWWSGRASAPGR